ncbi:Coiled-coil domain-containing protein 47 [Batrachochytrium dendrobatidis]|nr:Coiled-coil domain-containing protein 47 [Batrachochytrium dendrobatidis]
MHSSVGSDTMAMLKPLGQAAKLGFTLFVFFALTGYVTATNLDDFNYQELEDDTQQTLFSDQFSSTLNSDQSGSAENVVNKPRPLMSLDNITLMDFWFELLMILIATLYASFYLIGKRANREIARGWMKGTFELWQMQFSHIGSNDGHKLIMDGPRDFIFYASGRTFVKHVYGYVHLVARHDLVQWLIDYYLGNDQYDKVTLTFTFNDKVADPFTFAILPKATGDSIKANRWDLNNFPKVRDLPGFPKSHYMIMTDAPEFAVAVWDDPAIRATIFKSIGLDENGNGDTLFKEPLIDQIILTDLPTVKPETIEALKQPRTLNMTYRIPNAQPPTKDMIDTMCQMNQLGFDLVDYVGQKGLLSIDGKSKIAKLRQAAEVVVLKSQEEARKEELADKKIKDKKLKEEQIYKLSVEEQRKYEEKERKREQKRKDAKMKKKSKSVKM